MKLLSTISPDAGTTAGVLSAAGIYLIYQNAMPSVTDVRTALPHDTDVEGARKTAAYESAALLAVVFAVTRNLDAFIIGGSALFGIDMLYRHANAVHPATGRVDTTGDALSVAPGLSTATPLPDYSEDAA